MWPWLRQEDVKPVERMVCQGDVRQILRLPTPLPLCSPSSWNMLLIARTSASEPTQLKTTVDAIKS